MRISDWSSDVCSSDLLLVVSASLLGVALACVVLLGQWARAHGARRNEAGHEDAVGGSMWDGLKQIFANPFMRGMAVLLLLADGIGTVNYTLVTDSSGATFVDAVARTRFAANVDIGSEEHTSELKSQTRISYAVSCLN